MRILITGSREWTDEAKMVDALAGVRNEWLHLPKDEGVTLIHGSARGADVKADTIGRRLGFSVERHPADWGRYGKLAGHIRNQEMVDSGADLCLAFLVGTALNRGTRNCMTAAKLAGIEVREVWS